MLIYLEPYLIIKCIAKLIDYLNISVNEFEKKINASEGLIRKAKAKNTDIQAKWLVKIKENFPNISGDWLLAGTGEMIIDNTNIAANVNLLKEQNQQLIEKIEDLSKQIGRLEEELKTLKKDGGYITESFAV